jgi:putative Mn2+ efflux pump MntP
MGLFQFGMPILGWLAGSRLAARLATVGRFLAAAMVFAIGVKMLVEVLRAHGALAEKAEEVVEEHLMHRRHDPTRGWSLIMLSLATSIDALVAGFSLGLRSEHIYAASLVIGAVAAAMSVVGVTVGRRAGKTFGRAAEVGGALVLMALGISFLLL